MGKTVDEIFKAKNVINGLNLDIPIYKFIPLKYMSSLLSGILNISKIESWEDVYENFLFKQHFELDDGTPIKVDNLAKCNFGQSWTKSEETDAMWRIYSDVSKCMDLSSICKCCYCKNLLQSYALRDVAVRIKTTAKKLFDSVYFDDTCMDSTYIGNIQYVSQNELNEWLSNIDLKVNNLQKIITQSLFIKRNEFDHEQEIRLVCSFSESDKRVNSSMLQYSITPDTFIDEILIDPRLISSDFSKIIKDLLVCKGVNSKKIKVSSLYEFRPRQEPLLLS